MKLSRTTLRLAAAALGAVALFSAAAMAGASRGEEMRASGVLPIEHAAPAARPGIQPVAPLPRNEPRP